MTSKFGNRKVDCDGYTFDSIAEYRRYEELKLEVAAGEIQSLQVHPPFEIIPKFTDRDGKVHRARVYEADFTYLEHGHWIAEDVKGFETETFRIKRDLFLRAYPDYKFRITKVGR